MTKTDKQACLDALTYKAKDLEQRAANHYSCQDDGSIEDERHQMELDAKITRAIARKLAREWEAKIKREVSSRAKAGKVA